MKFLQDLKRISAFYNSHLPYLTFFFFLAKNFMTMSSTIEIITFLVSKGFRWVEPVNIVEKYIMMFGKLIIVAIFQVKIFFQIISYIIF